MSEFYAKLLIDGGDGIKKIITLIMLTVISLFAFGCGSKIEKITDIPTLSDMKNEADKIEVRYFPGKNAYDFTIDDKATINEMMELLFSASINYEGKIASPGSGSFALTITQGNKSYQVNQCTKVKNRYYSINSNALHNKLSELIDVNASYITDIPEYADMKAEADKISVNFHNYTVDGFSFDITDKEKIKSIIEHIRSTKLAYLGCDIAGNQSCQKFTIYQGDKIYTIGDYFKLNNGIYSFENHKLCDEICELATELGAWDEIKKSNDVFNGICFSSYIPDDADSISIGTLIDCYEVINNITITDKKKIAEILDILKRAEISNYDSPTSGDILYISIEYSVKDGFGISSIESQFDLRNRYFVVDTNELENYIKTIE